MFTSVPPLPEDLKEAAKRERIKQIEEERKKRIFNARRRLIGVDVEALQQQMAERKAQQELETAEDEAYLNKMKRDTDLANSLENQCLTNQKKLMFEINEFRKVHQRKEDRREFDLSDPEALKKSLPCRLGDDDPRISISSAQKFEGEEGCSGEKKRIKVEQQRSWLLQQMAEKRQHDKERELANSIYTESLAAREKRVLVLDQLEKDCEKQMASSVAAFNKALAAEQSNARKMQELRELEDKQMEIYNQVTSDFLTENPEVANSNLSLGKMVGSLYKGMTPKQKEEIRLFQARQRGELQDKRAEEMKIEKHWHEYTTKVANKMEQEEAKFANIQRERAKRIMQENERLKGEHKAHQEYLKKFVYTNRASEAFYQQFNKTTR